MSDCVLKDSLLFPQPPLVELRNGHLKSYTISYRELDPTRTNWQQLRVSATKGALSCVLKNLKPSTKYDVMVQALTAVGIGPSATAVCPTLDEGELGNRSGSPHLVQPGPLLDSHVSPRALSCENFTSAVDQFHGRPGHRTGGGTHTRPDRYGAGRSSSCISRMTQRFTLIRVDSHNVSQRAPS